MMIFFLSLPSDVLILIIDHLSVSDLVALTSVSRKLYDLVSTSSPPSPIFLYRSGQLTRLGT